MYYEGFDPDQVMDSESWIKEMDKEMIKMTKKKDECVVCKDRTILAKEGQNKSNNKAYGPEFEFLKGSWIYNGTSPTWAKRDATVARHT